MQFQQTSLPGVFTVDLQKHGDDRGFFARVFCRREHEEQGLASQIVQVNNSLGARKGTLRGLHYQLAPHAETKLVRCLRGSLWDVALDLRPGSETFGKWHGEILTSENRRMLYVPKGCAHGFITLEDDTEILYLVDQYYAPQAERTVRWNDPRFSIGWPLEPTLVSDKDASAPDFDLEHHVPGAVTATPS